MKTFRSILGISAIGIFLLVSSSQVFSQGRVAGILREIHGAAYWKKDSKAKEIKLDPRNDQARILYVGEQVRSGRSGALRLLLCDGEMTYRGRSWFPISVTQECPNRKAFEEYGRVGGRDRGQQSQVFSPTNHSATTPELFVLRWIPDTAKCTVSLTIQEIDGKTRWREDDIDGKLGLWDSPKARQALTEYRAEGEEAPLLLKFVDSCANRIDITFSLLSVESEASLKDELARWDRNPVKFMAHLGRAYVFESYNLFPEVAEEYEAALKLAPESRDLLKRTILAYRSTGNFAAEEQLIKRLPPRTTVP